MIFDIHPLRVSIVRNMPLNSFINISSAKRDKRLGEQRYQFIKFEAYKRDDNGTLKGLLFYQENTYRATITFEDRKAVLRTIDD